MTPSIEAIYARVQNQFGPVAPAYTTSAGHADPNQLRRVVELAQPKSEDRALDIATGTGHAALALAPHVKEVVALDLTPAMLAETSQNAARQGVSNIRIQLGQAESLPFADQSFEIVVVRIAAHHFADIQRAISEMARVLKPQGRVVIVDTTVPEEDELDSEINQIEMLRDPSHVRNYRPSQWLGMLRAVDLSISALEVDYYTENGPMKFKEWTARMKTPAAVVVELERRFRQASPALVQALQIDLGGVEHNVNEQGDDIRFCLPKVTVLATKK